MGLVESCNNCCLCTRLLQVLVCVYQITDTSDKSVELLRLICMKMVSCLWYSVHAYIRLTSAFVQFPHHTDIVTSFNMSHPGSVPQYHCDWDTTVQMSTHPCE